MDYYVFITRACNLRCDYCCFGDSVFQRDVAEDEVLEPARTARFILDHAKKKNEPDNKVFFYGGEPSLKRDWIEKFIEQTRGQLRYVLQTNGTKLRDFTPEVLSQIHFIEISIDGIREVHDARRGAGTFDRIVENIQAVRPWYPGELAARMTYTPSNPLARSVRMILDELRFDHVYWMHEDSGTPVLEWSESRDRYAAELDDLIEYWVEGLRKGAPKNIISFKAILSSLLDPPEVSHFRCGVGTYLRVIDIDGQCYPCDLMITQDKQHSLGHIDDEISEDLLPENATYEKRCKHCEVLTFCGGRCFNVSYNNDVLFDEFCARTKLLILKLDRTLPEVRDLLSRGVISREQVGIATTLTEQIP